MEAAEVKHRYRCEVRAILKMRIGSQQRALAYLALVAKQRGEAEAQRLKDDASSQWQRGNRGDYGVWR